MLTQLYYCFTDLIESTVLPPLEPLGHVIIREQLSTKYHQENDCNLIGPPQEILSIESFSSVESSAQVLESESSAETSESLLHKEDFQRDESLPNYFEAQDRSDPQMSFNPCGLAQHADNIPHSLQENRIHVGDKSIEINMTEEGRQRQILQEETPTFVNNSDSASGLFTDPLVIEHAEVTHGVEEESELCESVKLMLQSLTYKKQDETQHLEIQHALVDADVCHALQSSLSLDSCVPTKVIIYDGSDQSHCLAQEATTNSTQMATLLGSCGKGSPLDVKDNLSSPSCLDPPALIELPQFTNQRPPNLPSATGKRSPIASWNPSSLPTSPQRYHFAQVDILLDCKVN